MLYNTFLPQKPIGFLCIFDNTFQSVTTMSLNRRQFIRGMTLAGSGLMLIPACHRPISFWRVLTDDEGKLLTAITEQIIPADSDPGATDAGVVNFIDKQLAGFYSELVEDYRNGLAAFQQYCREYIGNQFEELEWDTQTQLLEELESNRIDHPYWKEKPASQFFNMIRNHTLQGFYGSPRHGGNKNYVSYKMMRLDYPHVIGRNVHVPRSETLNIYAL
jgi:gluconate 2-dehydrogenase gamma chain